MIILIVSYYELKEQLLYAAEAFTKLGHTVTNYPLFQKYQDTEDKIPNYVEDFIQKIEVDNPDVILWWFFSIPTDKMREVIDSTKSKSKPVKNILFNWDDPFNWAFNDLEEKSKFFDTVFVSSAEKINSYREAGADAHVLYPGFNPNVHNIIVDVDTVENHGFSSDDIPEYECDISFCVTNLYDNEMYPNQYINRKKLIDDIYENQKVYGYKFNIYGPEFLRPIYPESYKGFMKYEDTAKIFNYSKINLSTHVQMADSYLNERVILILASGGLLLIDDINNNSGKCSIEIGKDCVKIDKDRYIEQFVDILKNYDNYTKIRYNGLQKSKLFTWDLWAKYICENI